jgi:hypothetical protein
MMPVADVPPRYIEHIFQARPANSHLVRLVFGRWRLPERLAIVLLVQSPPAVGGIDSVVSLHKQVRAFARLPGGDSRRRDLHTFCQCQAERLVLNTAPQTRRFRLETIQAKTWIPLGSDTAMLAAEKKLSERYGMPVVNM